jgi:hypothetical protein
MAALFAARSAMADTEPIAARGNHARFMLSLPVEHLCPGLDPGTIDPVADLVFRSAAAEAGSRPAQFSHIEPAAYAGER